MKFLLSLWLAVLLLSVGAHADTQVRKQKALSQICLGWSGGKAGRGYKWVIADIVWKGNNATLTYEWAGIGTMHGVLRQGVLQGSWEQIGANGGFDFSLPDGKEHFTQGHWWNAKSPQQIFVLKASANLSPCN